MPKELSEEDYKKLIECNLELLKLNNVTPQQRAESLYKVGYAYEGLYQLNKALEFYDLCLEVQREKNNYYHTSVWRCARIYHEAANAAEDLTEKVQYAETALKYYKVHTNKLTEEDKAKKEKYIQEMQNIVKPNDSQVLKYTI